MNESHDQSDLDLQAFRYAAGELDAELDAEQTAAFETLLATSQAARERLAAMVALSQHVANAPQLDPVSPAVWSGRTRERIAALAVGAAMLLAAIWIGQNLRNENAASVPAANGERQAELADAWAESFVAHAGTASDDANVDAVGPTGVVPAGELADDEAFDVEVPDWMFAALGGDAEVDDVVPEEDRGGWEEMLPEATIPRDG